VEDHITIFRTEEHAKQKNERERKKEEAFPPACFALVSLVP
jgi:hypothetical protein